MKTSNFPILALLALSSVGVATAVVPEPGNLYCGLAKNFLGQDLTPEDNAEVVLVRIEGGREIVLARSSILDIQTPGGKVNYILRPSLDDGQVVRYNEATGRKDEPVTIYVIHNGVRFETTSSGSCAPISDPVPALGEKGSVRRISFRCIDDWDDDCMADSWERYHFQTTDLDGTGDVDGDGINDLAEFVGGTNPWESNQGTNGSGDGIAVPRLTIVLPRPGVAKLDWEKEIGVTYTLEWSGTLDDFVPVPADRIGGSDGNEVNISGMSKRFFRVRLSR